MTKYIALILLFFSFHAQAAVYKHRAFKGDSLQFEWASQSADPAPSNPYPSLTGLRFETALASSADEKFYTEAWSREATLKARESKLAILRSLKNNTSLTNAQRDEILLYLLKKELGE